MFHPLPEILNGTMKQILNFVTIPYGKSFKTLLIASLIRKYIIVLGKNSWKQACYVA